jgi:hypothetical protein
VWYISQEAKMGKELTYKQAGKCPLCLVPAGLSIRHICGWGHPAGEIPQKSCSNGDGEVFSFEQLNLPLQAMLQPGI